MPSHDHELHLLIFRNRPTLAPDVMCHVLGADLPDYREARVVSADLTDIEPAEYRADLVIELWDDKPAYGIVVEVQLAEDNRKRFAWPAYLANLRARLKCPVALLVITADDAVARWASQRIEMGGLHQLTPYVLGPSAVPSITDEAEARENPELAVLSAMAHGEDENVECAIRIATAARNAVSSMDEERSVVYLDLILNSLGEAARQALGNMDLRTYEFKSDFARHYIALGKEEGKLEGRTEGRMELIVRQLTRRFGPLESAAVERVRACSVDQLDAIGERLLSASTLEEVLGVE